MLALKGAGWYMLALRGWKCGAVSKTSKNSVTYLILRIASNEHMLLSIGMRFKHIFNRAAALCSKDVYN